MSIYFNTSISLLDGFEPDVAQVIVHDAGSCDMKWENLEKCPVEGSELPTDISEHNYQYFRMPINQIPNYTYSLDLIPNDCKIDFHAQSQILSHSANCGLRWLDFTCRYPLPLPTESGLCPTQTPCETITPTPTVTPTPTPTESVTPTPTPTPTIGSCEARENGEIPICPPISPTPTTTPRPLDCITEDCQPVAKFNNEKYYKRVRSLHYFNQPCTQIPNFDKSKYQVLGHIIRYTAPGYPCNCEECIVDIFCGLYWFNVC